MNYVTTKIAAEAVGVTRQTINNWIRSGSISVTVIDGVRMVKSDEVIRRAEWKFKHSEKGKQG